MSQNNNKDAYEKLVAKLTPQFVGDKKQHRFPCPKCKQYMHYTTHRISDDQKDRWYQCPDCEIMIDANEVEKWLICPKCGGQQTITRLTKNKKKIIYCPKCQPPTYGADGLIQQ